MTTADAPITDLIRRLLEESGVTGPDADPDRLAALIESDGRARLAGGQAVRLRDYLDAEPVILRTPVALDAAIDVALRALSGGSGCPTADAVESLVSQHPELEHAIRDAAMLGFIFATSPGHAEPGKPNPHRDFPRDFGPALPGGRSQYELRAILGSGSFGDVYLAVDRSLSDRDHEALVAIKVTTTATWDSLAQRHLAEEARKARRIQHPCVVNVLGLGVTDNHDSYVVYEYIRGGDLSTAAQLAELRANPRRAARFVAQLARGVQAVHTAGLVHCDLKPANIIIAADGHPKIADFGIARRLGAEQPTDTIAADSPLGSLAFMAPEQYRMEEGALGPPADIYALGGLLVWILTDQLPNGATYDAIAQRLGDTNPAPAAVHPALADADRDLAAIITRALAPRPADRYPAAASLADDLDAWADRLPIRWTRPSPLRIAKLWVRRRPLRTAAIAALVCLVGLAGALGATAYERDRNAEEAERRAAAEVGIREKVAPMVSDYYQMGQGFRRIGFFGEQIAHMWFTEWLTSPLLFRFPETANLFWAMRIMTLEAAADDNIKTAGPEALETMLLEDAACLWRLQASDFATCEERLIVSRMRWGRILHHDDPYLLIIDTLHRCAVAQRLIAHAAKAPLTAEQRAEARAARDDLAALIPCTMRSIEGGLTQKIARRDLAKLEELLAANAAP